MKVEDFEDILYQKEDNGICTAVLNQPERRNAVSYLTFLELYTIFPNFLYIGVVLLGIFIL